jgi:hypothetical protein
MDDIKSTINNNDDGLLEDEIDHFLYYDIYLGTKNYF